MRFEALSRYPLDVSHSLVEETQPYQFVRQSTPIRLQNEEDKRIQDATAAFRFANIELATSLLLIQQVEDKSKSTIEADVEAKHVSSFSSGLRLESMRRVVAAEISVALIGQSSIDSNRDIA